ncbi:MAG: efflux RND transporter permease subunit, partial [Eubacterium sp.]|nr:efflux RND transporter permease subunit [Eubacterium sp.]
STDLLPEINLPFLMVIAPYPGASPERVEATVIEPMENALGTINGVKNVLSYSYENYGMLQLEFEDGTNMDSAMVKMSSALDQLSGSLPDSAGTPTILEISMDMLATMYVAVGREGNDIYELSDFVRSDVVPYIERQDGVASVTTIGLVEKSVQVELNQQKIDDLNNRILEETNLALTDAREQLDKAQEEVDNAQAMLDEQKAAFGSNLSGVVFNQVDSLVINAANNLINQSNALIDQLNALNNAAYEAAQNGTDSSTAIADAQNNLNILQQQLADAEAQATAIEQQQAESQSLLDQLNAQLAQIQSQTPETEEEVAAQAAAIEEITRQIQELQASIDPSAQQNAAATVAAALAAVQTAQANLDQLVIGENDAVASAAALEAARLQLEQAASAFSSGAASLNASSMQSFLTAVAQVSAYLAQIQQALDAIAAADPAGILQAQINNAISALYALGSGLQSAPAALSGLQSGYAGLTQAQLEAAIGFSTATTQLSQAQAQLSAAQKQYETSREEALKNANADALLSAATLSQLIYAQNFEMPAGYIDDKDSNAWLLRIGDEFEDAESIADVLLVDSDPLGTVRLSDVADITVIDNSEDSYANLNSSEGVMLCIYKSSTAGTNEVSRVCSVAFKDLQERFDGTHIVPMMDQGVYITYIIKDILSSMLLGALLAILVLALFLRALKPTLVVAISIPLSVLFTLVLMYFTGLSLNMMTLSGLALGVGMLVDNSIVVMENIFRLRSRGIPAARAAVQGARQVRGAIIASTLTTICVFLPAAFASGTVRQFLTPLALTIGYCLTASLVVALTLVPAASSTLMKKTVSKEYRFFTRLQDVYGRSLTWCLRHKFITLAVAIGLLALSVWQILRMGIVYLPEMTSNFIEVDVSTPNVETREESYALADEVVDKILTVEGVNDIGVMDEGSTAGLFSAFAGNNTSFGSYIGYLVADENASPEEINRICDDVMAATDDLDCTVRASASGMNDLTSFSSSGGLTLEIYGQDIDMLRDIAAHTKELVEGIEGYTNVRDGSEEGEPTLQLHIDRDKAMSYGLTTAQIYTEIASRVETRVVSTSISVDGMDMEVAISDPTDPLTKENLLDMLFNTNAADMTMMAGAQNPSYGTAGGMGMGLGSLETMGDSDMMAALMGTKTEEDGEPPEDEQNTEEESVPETIRLGDIASIEETTSLPSITRDNMTRYLTVSAGIEEGYNTTLLSRKLTPVLNTYRETLPRGYTIELSGENSQISDMIRQMSRMLILALLFIYLIMVAQFQSLLSPFIVMFTIPLAFTGGMFGLIIANQQLTLLALMG